MRHVSFLMVAVFLVVFARHAHADTACGSAGKVWPADKDGSLRLTYEYGQGNDMVELINREEERVIIVRGFLEVERRNRELYAIYDFNNGNLVYALAKVYASTKRITGIKGFTDEYLMQSHFDIKVFAAATG